MTDTIDRPAIGETNGLVNGVEYHDEFAGARTVDWTTKGLYVTRLRLLSDPGFPAWDVSYVHGYIGKEPVRVQVPFLQLPKRGLRAAIVQAAIKDGIFAKRIGILDNISTLC